MGTSLAEFDETMDWLKNNYSNFLFYVERDVVWTVQTRLIGQIQRKNLPMKVYNDYGILAGNR